MKKRLMTAMLCTGIGGILGCGYAAVDKEPPVISQKTMYIEYGQKINQKNIKVTDNRDHSPKITIDNKNFDPQNMNLQKVHVTAEDSFRNQSEKDVSVQVKDSTGPTLSICGNGDSRNHVVSVPINASSKISNYVKAVDLADGNTEVVSDKKLDTKKLGTQDLWISSKDSSGNETKTIYHFFISDKISPKIKVKKNIVINYGSKFKVKKYYNVTDNHDKHLKIKISGKIDSKKEKKQSIIVTAMDSSGNMTEEKMNVQVKDFSRPDLKLVKKMVYVEKGSKFQAKDYVISAVDQKDGDIIEKVKFSMISTKKLGARKVVYSVSDKAGNVAKKILNVCVIQSDSPSKKSYFNDFKSYSGIVETTKSRLGCRYVYGAAGPNTFDCSGLTSWVYKKNGIHIPRSSSEQYREGKKISIKNLKPGDVVWRPGHVGIYAGKGSVIHAPQTGDVVRYTNASGFRCGLRFK